jgi:hypothetical protein
MMVHATFSTYRWRRLNDCCQQKHQSDAYHLPKSNAKFSVASCMNESPGERRIQTPVQSYNHKWWKWPTSWYKLHFRAETHTDSTCFTRHTQHTDTHTTDTHNWQVVVVVSQSTTLMSRSNKTAQRLKETQPKIMGKWKKKPPRVWTNREKQIRVQTETITLR